MITSDGLWEYEYRNTACTKIEITRYKGPGLSDGEELVIPAEIERGQVIWAGGFRGHGLAGSRIVVSEGIEEIRASGFRHSSFSEITLPSTLKRIQQKAFFGCTVNKVTVQKGLRIIGREAFRYCRDLKEIQLPDTVVYLGTGAFEACSNLHYAAILAEKCNIGRFAFAGCDSLAKVKYSEKARCYFSFPKHTTRDIICFDNEADLRVICDSEVEMYDRTNMFNRRVIETLPKGTLIQVIRRYCPSVQLYRPGPDYDDNEATEKLAYDRWVYVRVIDTGKRGNRAFSAERGYITQCTLSKLIPDDAKKKWRRKKRMKCQNHKYIDVVY